MPKDTTRAPRRQRGRPRVSAPGSKPIYTTLAPELVAKLEALAAAERRSVSVTAAILIEEALRARKESR